jgi:hypothetical protein
MGGLLTCAARPLPQLPPNLRALYTTRKAAKASRELGPAAGASATLAGNTLTVTSGGTSESSVLDAAYTAPGSDPQLFKVVGYSDDTGTLRAAKRQSNKG